MGRLRDLEVLETLGKLDAKTKLDILLELHTWQHWLSDAMPMVETVKSSLEDDSAFAAAGMLRVQQAGY